MAKVSEQAFFWIGLSSIPGVGRVTFRKLLDCFGTAERVLAASKEELIQRGGISEKVAQEITTFSWRDPAMREVDVASRTDVSLLTSDDPDYPTALKAAADAPLVLYVRGFMLPADEAAVAMVGTRTPTHYGIRVARSMASDLATSGMTVVSGMARGIDTHAHRGALDAGGRTIAVLGSGIDVPYPPENRGLMEQIASSGAVVSENPFGTQPESGYFPARNRIISGLSRATVIIEAAEDSGSLITADYTLKQGRKLFAVPGNVGSRASRGTNSLIKQGATLAESASDILSAIGRVSVARQMRDPGSLPSLDDTEATVLSAISFEPKHVDVLMSETGFAPGRLGGLLTGLELKGLVKQLPGKYFIRAEMT